MSKIIRIALIAPSKLGFSETFIQAHREKLNGVVHYLYGGFMPSLYDDDILIAKQRTLAGRVREKIGLSKSRFSFAEINLCRFLKEKKINLVFAEYGPTGAEVLDICKALGIPLVVHFHGFDAHKKDIIELYKERYCAIFSYASFLVSVSKVMSEALIRLGADPQKIILTPCGPNEVFLKNDFNINSNSFLAVGRFAEKKAPYLTLAAFKLVHDQYPEARLIFAGNGISDDDLSDVCFNLSKFWGLSDVVRFVGPVHQPDVVDLMKESFCFVQHSITTRNGDSEGTPVAVMEASLGGLPVVSTLHAGIKDIIKNGETGFLVPEGDVKAMAEYMLQLLNNKEQAMKMGISGRGFIKENYSMKKHIQTINDALARI